MIIFATADDTPFTIVCNVFVDVDTVLLLIVLNEVFVLIPLTFEVIVAELVEVATVNELLFIIFVTADDTPLTIICNRFALDEAAAVLIIDEDEVTPFTFEVKVFVAEERVLLLITLVVALTPFTVVVSTFPVTL